MKGVLRIMALFGAERNYNTIVAPLKRIEGELKTYIGNQKSEITGLEKDKVDIDTKISNKSLEVKKSEHTAAQISSLLATDFDGDGEADFVEPEPPSPDVK